MFQECTSLEKTTIPDGATIIEREAFQNCKKLDSITIPSTVISILSGAFYSCTNLEAVEFEKDSKLKNIEDYVFAYCGSLKSIQIPANVITILCWKWIFTGQEKLPTMPAMIHGIPLRHRIS